jgi:hypothetical protein
VHDDLFEPGVDEDVELDLDHGQHPIERHPDGRADDAGLGERGIDDPVLAELIQQSRGDAEDAAGLRYVLPQ